MKLFISILVCIYLPLNIFAQKNSKPLIIYGAFKEDSLRTAPHNSWFTKNYDEYQPDSSSLVMLKKQNMKDISILVFMGTWCGDSKREVPRFMKLLHDMNFPTASLQLIGVGSDSLKKQSPQGEEKGLGIFRVPTFIIYKKGVEINRINEFPAVSLEKDFLKIVTNQPLQPNYRSFATINQWLNDGTLQDVNSSTRSLAEQLRQMVGNENELNSLGYLLLGQQQKQQALRIFQVNSYLYPQSANISSSLGEGYFENGDYDNAIKMLERSIEQNKDPQALKEILAILYKSKEKMTLQE